MSISKMPIDDFCKASSPLVSLDTNRHLADIWPGVRQRANSVLGEAEPSVGYPDQSQVYQLRGEDGAEWHVHRVEFGYRRSALNAPDKLQGTPLGDIHVGRVPGCSRFCIHRVFG